MTSTSDSIAAGTLSEPQLYATSSQKIGYEAYCWGQPPAAHYVLAVTDHFVTGAERGVYASSSIGFNRETIATLQDEFTLWQAARDEAFLATGLDL